ncbi:hypothetical protein J4234_00360 [Candidatus Woesearchaeota archaeon]|nr:hypothetical protein [Candidatus Woesearchaeota archaeon]
MPKLSFLKNKKSAIEVSLIHLLEIILAIIVISVLIYVSLRLSGLLIGKQEYESTVNNLEALSTRINALVKDDKSLKQTMVYTLPNDFILVGFNYQDQAPVKTDCTQEIISKSRPNICQSKPCLCIYKNHGGIADWSGKDFDGKGTTLPLKCKTFEGKIVFLTPQKDPNFQGSSSQWKPNYSKWNNYNYLVLYGICGGPWRTSWGIRQIYLEKHKEGENTFIFIGDAKNNK